MWVPKRTVLSAVSAALALVIGLCAPAASAAEDLPSLLRNGERAREEGRLADAAALFGQAELGWPQDDAAARGSCEVGLATAGKGLITPAVGAACHKAFLLTQSARDMRNKAAALLSEKAKPDLDQVAIAALLADASVKQTPGKPWGFLIRRDIARHLGRADLLAASETDLQRFAGDPIVQAALREPVGRAPVSIWLVRILVLLGLAGTSVHALARRRRSVRPGQLVSAAAAVLLALFALLTPARAFAESPGDMPVLKDKFSQLSPFKIDDAHPDLAVKALLAKSKDPLQLGYLLQDLAVRADDATTKGDNPRAARYYHALALAAPTPYGPRMECQALEASGDIPNAIRACRELLQRPGVLGSDYVHFIDVVLKNPNPLPELEPKELEGVIAHLEKEAKIGDLAKVLRCKVALRFEDPAALDACNASMSTLPSNDPAVISIKWGLAVRRNDKPAALVLVERGRRAGMSRDAVLQMLQTTEGMNRGRFRKVAIVGGLAALILAAGFFAVRMLASSRQRTAGRSAA